MARPRSTTRPRPVARLTTLRPPPRFREPLSYGDVEAGLAALGVDLSRLLTRTGEVRFALPDDIEACALPFLDAVLDAPSARRARGYSPALRAGVTEWTAQTLADTIGRAAAEVAARRQAHVERLEPLLRGVFADWRAGEDGPAQGGVTPLGVTAARDGYDAWRTIHAAPFLDVLLYAVDLEVAAFHAEMDESARKTRELLRERLGERLGGAA